MASSVYQYKRYCSYDDCESPLLITGHDSASFFGSGESQIASFLVLVVLVVLKSLPGKINWAFRQFCLHVAVLRTLLVCSCITFSFLCVRSESFPLLSFFFFPLLSIGYHLAWALSIDPNIFLAVGYWIMGGLSWMGNWKDPQIEEAMGGDFFFGGGSVSTSAWCCETYQAFVNMWWALEDCSGWKILIYFSSPPPPQSYPPKMTSIAEFFGCPLVETLIFMSALLVTNDPSVVIFHEKPGHAQKRERRTGQAQLFKWPLSRLRKNEEQEGKKKH